MTPAELEGQCISAHLAGCHTITLTLPSSADFKRPLGFPRGELLSINAAGDRNYAFDPLKLLSWLRSQWTPNNQEAAK